MTPTDEEVVMFVQFVDLTGLDASPAAMTVVDLPTREVTSMNPSATTLFGTSAAQAIGRPVSDFGVGGEDLDGLLTVDDAGTGIGLSLVQRLVE